VSKKQSGVPLEIKYFGFQDHKPFNHNIGTFTQVNPGAMVLGAKRDHTGFISIAMLINPSDTTGIKEFLWVEDGTPIEIAMKELRFIARFRVVGRSAPQKKRYRYLFEII
jgi:hypothetical protein